MDYQAFTVHTLKFKEKYNNIPRNKVKNVFKHLGTVPKHQSLKSKII